MAVFAFNIHEYTKVIVLSFCLHLFLFFFSSNIFSLSKSMFCCSLASVTTLLVITYRKLHFHLTCAFSKWKQFYSFDLFAANNPLCISCLELVFYSVHCPLALSDFPPAMTFFMSLLLTHIMCPSALSLLLCTWVTCNIQKVNKRNSESLAVVH